MDSEGFPLDSHWIPIGFPLDYTVPETAETVSKNNVLADSLRTFVAANENQNNQLFFPNDVLSGLSVAIQSHVQRHQVGSTRS